MKSTKVLTKISPGTETTPTFRTALSALEPSILKVRSTNPKKKVIDMKRWISKLFKCIHLKRTVREAAMDNRSCYRAFII
ncbi:hypothetical protein [Salisediminibacterium beveridgei]|uniref:hypothetical protein n=1 Tax=Salisediminibacterium beveridgei TaxID=632773 RepID=UPI0012ED438B|nr:hypothetical protein [Salisediminibacterium beveridgei]